MAISRSSPAPTGNSAFISFSSTSTAGENTAYFFQARNSGRSLSCGRLNGPVPRAHLFSFSWTLAKNLSGWMMKRWWVPPPILPASS